MKRVYREAFGPGPSTSISDEPRRINVMFLCEEWVSSKGGLATFNREFAVNLAKTPSDKINVHCYVSKSNESDREDAKNNGVNLITAQSIPGTSDPLDWLKFPPPELPNPDIVIGHGRKFGTPAYCIVRTTNCKWVQFVHVFCEDLGKYKQSDENRRSASNTIAENEKKHKSEVELCKAADVVVAVGSRLQQKYSRCLPGIEVQVITPGILENFSILSEKKLDEASPDEFSIFVFGRGTYEDLALKGYDIIADAIGCLGEKFKMTFVGSPEGEHRNIEDWFLQKTKITRRQVTIRSYCDQDELKMMFHESDLVALPSRTEGFGLVALEAISAGVPVLVTSESGIAKALEKVEGGKSVVVESEKPEEWSEKIQQLSRQKPEERHGFAIQLREIYSKAYSWDVQCEKFKETMQHLTDRPPRTARLNDSTWGSGKNVGMMASFLAEYSGDATALANKTNLSGVKDNDKATSSLVENKGWNLLHAASQGGDVDIIESMLSLGLDINSRDSLGTTPVMVAAASGKMEAVDFLLVKGADPSLTTNIGRNLLHAAAEGGNLSIVETMLSKHIAVDLEDNDGITSLMIAASKNNLEIVDYLLGKGADPNLQSKKGRNVFLIAAEYGSIAVIERLLSCGLNIDSRDGEGNTPLMCAAALAKLETFNLILEKGADPLLKGKSGWSLLHFACQGGNVAIIETILSRGIDIDEIANSIGDLTPLVVTIVFNKLEAMKYLLDKGADPSLENSFRKVNSLHLATIGGNIDIIDAILSRGFDINTPSSEGLTSLMFAAFTKNVAVVEYLLHKGADPALSDHLGRTCLHYASEGGDVTVIEKCLSHGVDVESKDSEGKTPLMLAAAKGNSDAVKYLLQRSAIPSQTGTAE